MQENDSRAPSEDRQVKLDEAWQLNFALSALAIVAALCFWTGKGGLHLLSAIVLAALPAVLIYLACREPLLYALGKQRGEPRTDMLFGFFVCGISLVFGDREVHFVDTTKLFECAVLIALLGCVVFFSAARKNPQFWSTMFVMLLLAGVYGWGLTAAVDSLADRSAPAHYTTMVVDRHESYHRGTTYHLALAPWGPMQEAVSLNVSKDTYYSMAVGQQVCVDLHPGVLFVQWYRIATCDNSGQ
jgi:hypothetical protein